jgi:hypothetical protein
MAAACCYAEFADDNKHTPLGYWKLVAEEKREFYRKQACALIRLVRDMPTVKP